MKTKALTLVVIALSVLVLVISCATKAVITRDGYLFETMAEAGGYTATTTDQSLLSEVLSLDQGMINRINRVSFQLSGDKYVAAVEGDIPKSAFKVGMFVSQDFNKKKGEAWYSNADSSIKMNIPENNLVILTNSDYPSAEAKVLSLEKPKLIDPATTALMAEADLALFSVKPDGLPSIALFQGGFSTDGIENLLIWAKDEKLNMRISFSSDRLSSAFMKLLKLSYVAKLKKNNIEYTLDQLKEQFIINGTDVEAKNLYMVKSDLVDLISTVRI